MRKGNFSPPTAQKKSAGYRYYSTEAVTDLMQVLRLRDAGLSLREIGDFIENGASAAERAIAGMEERLTALFASLELTCAMCVKKGDYTVSRTKLPAMRCLARELVRHSVEETVERMYGTFAAGPVRECYLDSRREYARNTDRYVTRLVLPILDGAGLNAGRYFPGEAK